MTTTDTDTAGIEPDGPEQPEVVRHLPATPEPQPESALDAAARAAIEMPGLPGRDEFLALAMQARMLSLSGAAPEAIRNDPYVAFHVAMVGRDLGISPSAAIELIDVIDTKKGPRLSLSPQLLNGQVRRLGLGSIEPVIQERDRCVARAVGPDGTVLGETEFTWEDARDAELVGPGCQPGNHTDKCRNPQADRRYRCNQGYVTYPRRMMWWRAAGFCADDWFPEAGLGLYSPEELGALVDEHGRPIDPATVALPEGYPEPGQVGAGSSPQADDTLAESGDLWELQERIQALPEGLRDELRDAWAGPQSRVRGHRASRLPARLLRNAKAMVNGFEAKARSGGADLAQELAGVRWACARAVTAALLAGWNTPDRWADADATPATAPPDGPEPDAAPTPPAEAAGTQDGEPGPESGDASADGRDWAPEMAGLARRVQALGNEVPADVVERIVAEVKPMHHATINRHLGEAGVPADGPIDMRRMHLSLVKMRQWLAEQRGTPDPYAQLCDHGRADGYCTEQGCPHTEEPF